MPDNDDHDTPRIDRLEAGLVGLADATGQTVPAIEEIKAELPTDPWPTKAEDVAAFDEMVNDMIDRGDIDPDTGQVVTRERAEQMANQYLNDMAEGRRDAQGKWVGDGPAPG